MDGPKGSVSGDVMGESFPPVLRVLRTLRVGHEIELKPKEASVSLRPSPVATSA